MSVTCSKGTILSGIVSILAIVIYLLSNHSGTEISLLIKTSSEPEYPEKPYAASWKSWWHPERISGGEERHLRTLRQGQGGGAISSDWNILYHLGGNGPWIEKVDGVVEGGIAAPEGCNVEQVHMMARHSERYPTIKAGSRLLNLVKRIKNANITYQGDMKFVNSWDFFVSDPQAQFEQLTTTGPFSGTLGAFTTGVKLRTRYHHLLPFRFPRNGGKTRLWASDCERVIDTARYFSAGFFGFNWNDTATLHIIPETAELGADTLTPGDTCLTYLKDKEQGHDKGAVMLAEYRANYIRAIRVRLSRQNPEISFTDDEIYGMQEMCGFEITVRGSSHWCDIFTKDEFLSFEYARDVIHYYRSGPGTPYGGIMGWLWLNATTNLLLEGPSAGPFFFSFVHDGDIAPMLTALNIFPDSTHLPITHIAKNRRWRTSQVSPMGARIIFERLACRKPPGLSQEESSNGTFIRININDGVVALPRCDSGPGHSCPLSEFQAHVAARGKELGDFRQKCGLSDDMPDRITFLHQRGGPGFEGS